MQGSHPSAVSMLAPDQSGIKHWLSLGRTPRAVVFSKSKLHSPLLAEVCGIHGASQDGLITLFFIRIDTGSARRTFSNFDGLGNGSIVIQILLYRTNSENGV